MTDKKEQIKALLGNDSVAGMSRKKKVIIGVLAVLAISAGSWWLGSRDAGPRYLTEAITQGTLSVEVTANGTLEAEQTVSIGSELSGIVEKVMVDVNDVVKANDVLIELDTSNLKASVEKAKASLASAQASQKEAQATLKEAQAKYQRLTTSTRF